jgi:hypothetical protein
MSFDLYFVRRPDDDDWDAAMDGLAANARAEVPATATDRDLWQRVEASIRTVLPDVEASEGDRFSELTDPDTAIQVFLSPGEIALSVPFWYEGEEADRIVELLRRVVGAIEAETGLTAYDPQDDRAFLGAEGDPRRVFDEVADTVGHLGPAPATPAVSEPAPRRSWLQRLFGRTRR